MQLRVSVIVPVYNVEPYIEECLRSVGDQTVADGIECIIVDDRGIDNSIKIAEEFIDRYNGLVNFQIVTRDKNGGLSAARNSGIEKAKGEYLYFLDSDDYIVPNAIELLLTLADKYGGVDLIPALYQTDDGRMDHFNKDAFPEFSNDRHKIKRALLDYDKVPVTAANRLIRRQLVVDNELYFKEGIIHEDCYWTYFLAKFVNRMAFCPEKIYYYRITEGSITRNIDYNKESMAFYTIISDFSNNIDNFEKGEQKKLILNYICIMLNNKYYKSIIEKHRLFELFKCKNTFFERILLSLYFLIPNNKLMHMIMRIYKFD